MLGLGGAISRWLLLPMLLLISAVPFAVMILIVYAVGSLLAPEAEPTALERGQPAAVAPAGTTLDPTLGRLSLQLESSVARTRQATRAVNDRLLAVKDKLAAEQAAVQGMRGLLDEMKREASSPGTPGSAPASLEARKGALELRYNGWQAARSEFETAAKELEASLAETDGEATSTEQAAQALEDALRAALAPADRRTGPQAARAAVSEYRGTAESARRQLLAFRGGEAELARTASSIIGQSDALTVTAAAIVVPAPVLAVPSPAPARPVQTPRAQVASVPAGPQPPTGVERAVTAGQPQFLMGFKILADAIPAIVGRPLENERSDPATGNTVQRTTTGLMIWDRSTDRTTFTNGTRTWTIGPRGLEERDNSQQLDWERQPT